MTLTITYSDGGQTTKPDATPRDFANAVSALDIFNDLPFWFDAVPFVACNLKDVPYHLDG